ncbi:MAG: TIM-barrel domain-containing protein [Candidatus Promineifilaceae bacterium]|jgi:putative sterol carrier protein
MIYTQSFDIQFEPLADPRSVVQGADWRFTVLTPRLLRLEYSAEGVFEDRPSQAFWFRRQPVPDFALRETVGGIEIETDYLLLRYETSEEGFMPQSLTITLKETGTVWQYGEVDNLNLLGTARTLDNVDGALALEQGLVSRVGWAVYDDSENLVFDETGWLATREGEGLDLYFFGYGRDYQGCLKDFAAVAGPAPLLPRWALGNWWSRFWAYTDRELLDLMDDFRAHDVPLSTCIVDMDWHITDTGNASSGWTGYTWNRELFPDPPAFIAELHRRGLKTALNLHPADGVWPHEEQYEGMAEQLGLAADGKTPVAFDIADPEFTRAYFELLHHPYEKQGVDFWWMDWQQGTVSGLAGLDPLWWLNHLHFYDLARAGSRKRPFVFSRWGGLGNHRYPIGFSGDAVVTWESLAFQPYFTATAANVNYGWWSHDIGGHMGGIEEAELYTRWVQFGVFSPIFRLHSTDNPFHERRPWGYDRETEAVTSAAMRLRHALIPYLYTMSWRNHVEHMPLIRPMYHDHPTREAAYHCPDQYYFGSELIVAPFISQADEGTRLSRQTVWLPEGEWFDFFRSERYPGGATGAATLLTGSWHAVYGGLEDIPVFARAGAIVPLAVLAGWSDTGNPAALAVHLFPGADNVFDLYEDAAALTADDADGADGAASLTDSGVEFLPCLTPISQSWSAESWQVSIGAAAGDASFLPQERFFELHFRGVQEGVFATAVLDGHALELTPTYDAETNSLIVGLPAKKTAQTIVVTVSAGEEELHLPQTYCLQSSRRMLKAFKMDSWVKMRIDQKLPAIVQDLNLLARYEFSLSAAQTRALVEVISGSGFHRGSVRRADEEEIVLWNNNGSEAISFTLAAEAFNFQREVEQGPLPRFAVLHVGRDALRWQKGTQSTVGQISVADWFGSLIDRLGLVGRLGANAAGGETAVVQFSIQGAQGYEAFLTLAEDGRVSLAEGYHETADVTITAEDADWLALINGLIGPEEAFLGGKLQIAGDLNLALQMAQLISLAPPGTFLPQRWRLDLNYLDILTMQLGKGSAVS